MPSSPPAGRLTKSSNSPPAVCCFAKLRVPASFSLHSSRHRPARETDPNVPGCDYTSDKSEPGSLREGRYLDKPVVETVRTELMGLGSGTVSSTTGGQEMEEGMGMHQGNHCGASGKNGRERKKANREERETGKRQSVAEEDAGHWYSFVPEHGVLLPGEKLELRFTVLVSAPVPVHAGSRRAFSGNSGDRCDFPRRSRIGGQALHAPQAFKVPTHLHVPCGYWADVNMYRSGTGSMKDCKKTFRSQVRNTLFSFIGKFSVPRETFGLPRFVPKHRASCAEERASLIFVRCTTRDRSRAHLAARWLADG